MIPGPLQGNILAAGFCQRWKKFYKASDKGMATKCNSILKAMYASGFGKGIKPSSVPLPAEIQYFGAPVLDVEQPRKSDEAHIVLTSGGIRFWGIRGFASGGSLLGIQLVASLGPAL